MVFTFIVIFYFIIIGLINELYKYMFLKLIELGYTVMY